MECQILCFFYYMYGAFLIFYCPRIWKNLFKLPANNTYDTVTTSGDDSFCGGVENIDCLAS